MSDTLQAMIDETPDKPVFNPYERVADNSPNRCQGDITYGQCQLIRMPGSSYCIMHGGPGTKNREAKDNLRNYRLTKFNARIGELGSNANVKSLRDEIGIMRMLVEEKINTCTDTSELLLNSTVIADLVGKIEKLVGSCHKIEEQMDLLMDKTQATQLIQEVSAIITRHVTEELVLGKIADEIKSLLGTVK